MLTVATGAAAQDHFHHHPRSDSDKEDEEELSVEEKPSEDVVAAVAHLKENDAVVRLNAGRLEDLPLDSVRDLIEAVPGSENGSLRVAKVRYMLKELIDPPSKVQVRALDRVLNKLLDSDESRTMSAEELHMLLTSGPPTFFVTQLREIAEDHRREHDHRFDVIPDKNTTALVLNEASRDDLAGFVRKTVDRHDAFMTLPITLIYIFVFIFLVWQHLRIEDRRDLAESMRDWVNGREPYTALDENCEDMGSFWEWLEGVGLPGLISPSNFKVNPFTNFSQYVVASRNIVIGDAFLLAEDMEGRTAGQWLLQADVAQQHLASNPKDHLGAAILTAQQLRSQGWDRDDVEHLMLRFLSYSESVQMYGVTDVKVHFQDTGHVRCVIDTFTVMVHLYPYWPVMIVDVFFLVILAFLSVQELRDMVGACRLSFHEFLDYWKFWNVVDWISITLGFCTCGMWTYMIIIIGDGALNKILDSDHRLKVDVMNMTIEDVEEIEDTVDFAGWILFFMHLVMAANTLTIVLKFFKAFESNPRLEVVTDTLRNASGDLCHFMIIFLTIFLPFAIIGHILFGQDLADFSSVSASVNTGIISLMGEFAWYVEGVGPLQLTQTLPSGIPKLFVFIWYFVYMFMVLLVLLNMLLAIIVKHYSFIAEGLGEDAPSLWRQVGTFVRFQKETRGFIPLDKLARGLDNDEDPAHEDDYVTPQSLGMAFPGMSEEQAVWLSAAILQELEREDRKKRAQADYRGVDYLENLMEGTAEDIKVASKAAQAARDKLGVTAADVPVQAQSRQSNVEEQDDARLDALERDVDKILQKLTAIIGSAKERSAMGPAKDVHSVTMVPAKSSVSDLPTPSAARDRSSLSLSFTKDEPTEINMVKDVPLPLDVMDLPLAEKGDGGATLPPRMLSSRASGGAPGAPLLEGQSPKAQSPTSGKRPQMTQSRTNPGGHGKGGGRGGGTGSAPLGGNRGVDHFGESSFDEDGGIASATSAEVIGAPVSHIQSERKMPRPRKRPGQGRDEASLAQKQPHAALIASDLPRSYGNSAI